jgi:hypothetical protein
MSDQTIEPSYETKKLLVAFLKNCDSLKKKKVKEKEATHV